MKLDQAAARGGGRPTGAGWAPRMTVFGAAQQKAVHGKVNVGKLDKDLKVNQEEVNDALADRIVIMTGWLEKRKKGVNNWKKRWFILKRNVLLYFKDETGTELKGVLFTDRLRVEARRRPPTPYSEKDAKLAQMLGQLQPFLAVFAPECVGQLAYFGPT